MNNAANRLRGAMFRAWIAVATVACSPVARRADVASRATGDGSDTGPRDALDALDAARDVPTDGASDARTDAAPDVGMEDATDAGCCADATTVRADARADTTTEASAPSPRRLEILCRAAWRAAAARSGLVPHTLERLTVHHAGVVLTDDRQAPQRVRSYQRNHQARGWPDIAYHWIVDRRGNVYEGRTVTARGDTATSYDPAGHFLVMADGDFDRQPVSEAQLEAVADMLAWGVRRFGLPIDTLGGHRDYAMTSCPGSALARRLSDGTLRRRVESRLASGGVDAVVVCGPEAKARVAAIEAGQ